ncbi:hypothetical protein EBR96_10585, partial [bacterium]|nr:hypothetical protein [bacterium]
EEEAKCWGTAGGPERSRLRAGALWPPHPVPGLVSVRAVQAGELVVQGGRSEGGEEEPHGHPVPGVSRSARVGPCHRGRTDRGGPVSLVTGSAMGCTGRVHAGNPTSHGMSSSSADV